VGLGWRLFGGLLFIDVQLERVRDEGNVGSERDRGQNFRLVDLRLLTHTHPLLLGFLLSYIKF
jgi:hypothetical protein